MERGDYRLSSMQMGSVWTSLAGGWVEGAFQECDPLAPLPPPLEESRGMVTKRLR